MTKQTRQEIQSLQPTLQLPSCTLVQ